VALDAQLGSKIEKGDDSIEILGPFPAGTTSKVRKSVKQSVFKMSITA
jgi:hypothetical protein